MNREEMIVRVFKALGHPIRLKIVKYILIEPQCVCKLNENIEFSQSNLSQHIKILKDSGIIKGEKQGLNIEYSIANDNVKYIINMAEEFVEYYLNNIK